MLADQREHLGRRRIARRNHVLGAETAVLDDFEKAHVAREDRRQLGAVDAARELDLARGQLEAGEKALVVDLAVVRIVLHQRHQHRVGAADVAAVLLEHLHVRMIRRHRLAEARVRFQAQGLHRHQRRHQHQQHDADAPAARRIERRLDDAQDGFGVHTHAKSPRRFGRECHRKRSGLFSPARIRRRNANGPANGPVANAGDTAISARLPVPSRAPWLPFSPPRRRSPGRYTGTSPVPRTA